MVGARTFLPASRVGMVVDVGTDFPAPMRAALESYGDAMFWFRPRADGAPTTTRALNIYSGEERGSVRPFPLRSLPLSRASAREILMG